MSGTGGRIRPENATYLLHSYYRQKGVEYRYFKEGRQRRQFERTKKGAYKYWELERCLNNDHSPIDHDTANNLRFLIGLRHEIEHQMTLSLDAFLSGRYQACALNYNTYLKQLFGTRQGLDKNLSFSLQFLELSTEQISEIQATPNIPKKISAYISGFDAGLNHEEYNSERFSYRLLFKKKLVNRPGQADRVIEFIDPKSDAAKMIDKEYWVKKEVEKPKYRATDVVVEIKKAGFPKFSIYRAHVDFWKAEKAKDPAKGFGVEIQGSWYWYDSWIQRCLELCHEAGDKYK